MRNLIKKAGSRLRSTRGESLVECMIAMVIITIAGLMLAGAIVSSARLNATVEKSERAAMFPKYASATGSEKTVTLSGDVLKKRYTREMRPDDGEVGLGKITVYTDDGELVYYE
jgi:Tfp pilus assembly protein PilX